MTLDFLILIAGLLLLVFGGDVLVRGSVGLAKSFGISTLIVGLTVVAFGTSAPELAVNILAAIDGNGDLSFGNIIGSNIANVGLILGLTALLKPVAVHPSILKRDIPIMLLATGAVVAMCYDSAWTTAAPGATPVVDQVDRGDGIILVMIFGMFLVMTIRSALRERKGEDPVLADKEAEIAEVGPPNVWIALLLTLGGLVGVVLGGKFTVDGASAIARALEVSDVIIGLTIVAVGTSLPELATCVSAVRKGHTDIAVGNVVGSNIWNLLLILSVTSIVRAIVVPAGGYADLWMCAGLSAAMLPLAMRGERHIGRIAGLFLLIAYVAFIVWRTVTAMPAVVAPPAVPTLPL